MCPTPIDWQTGLKLTHAVETRFHADFVSRLGEPGEQQEVTIGARAEAPLAFEHQPLAQGDEIRLGELTFATRTMRARQIVMPAGRSGCLPYARCPLVLQCAEQDRLRDAK